MPVDIIKTREHFQALRLNWEGIYAADPEAQMFLSWQWLWQLYERRSDDVLILAYREASPVQPNTAIPASASNSDYYAFMPVRQQLYLSKEQKRFMMIYRMTGNHWADYTGLLCSPLHEQAAISAFGHYLSTLSWSRLYLECLKISDTRLQLLTQAFDKPGFSMSHRQRRDSAGESDLLRSPRIELPDTFEQYICNCVSANTRQRIRRFGRKLAADSELAISLSTADTQESDLRHFKHLWKKRWAKNKGSKVDSLARRYTLIIRQALDDGNMRMAMMSYNSKPIAMSACYVDEVKQTILFFVGARDPSFSKVPSGLLLHVSTIQWAIEQGFRYYDLLSGDEPYKYSLGGQDQLLKSLLVSVDGSSKSSMQLDNSYLDLALARLRKRQRSLPQSTVEQLYEQLRLNWPQAQSVARQFDKWFLGISGNG